MLHPDHVGATLQLLGTEYLQLPRLLNPRRSIGVSSIGMFRAGRGHAGPAFDFPFNGATFHQTVIPRTNVTLNTASDKFTDIVARISLDYKFDIGAPVQTRY